MPRATGTLNTLQKPNTQIIIELTAQKYKLPAEI